MIAVRRGSPPAELTDELQIQLTAKYKVAGESVWNLPFLKAALLMLTNGKCCYCECTLEISGNYLEVEHFRPKSLFPDDVLQWENLLPCCKRCNAAKGAHNVVASPIIDPTVNTPAKHLSFFNYRLVGHDVLGINTVEVLNLNDPQKLVYIRFRVGDQVLSTVGTLLEVARQTSLRASASRRNRIMSGLKSLLREASPESEYSSTVATVLLACTDYQELKLLLVNEGLWDDELELYERTAATCELPVHKARSAV